MSISEDSILVRETLNNIQTLKKKYPKFTLEQLPDALEINEKYGIPIDEIRYYGEYELVWKYSSFRFLVCHKYDLTNKETFYKFDTSKWYIRLTFGRCGRFNFVTDSRCLSDSLYYEKTNELYQAFLEKLISYSPLDYDRLNGEYLFTVENGYRLYKDFKEIYETTKTAINNELKNFKIKQLKAELEKLETDS
jgi:hypothetical protein